MLTSTRKNMLKRPSLTSTVTRLAAVRFALTGARSLAEVAMVAAVLVARAATTVARRVTCRETALSRRKAVAAVEARIASTAANLDTCPGIARNPRSPESLVVALAAAVGASTVGRPDTCPGNALSQRSPESHVGLAVDLLAGMTTERVSLFPQ